MALPYIAIGAALLLFALYKLYVSRTTTTDSEKQLPFPPGPKPLPVLGNALDMPKECEWLVYEEWRKTYGDLIYMTVLGQPLLILNSLRAASDLLEKRSAIYSDRIKMTFAGEMVGWNRATAMTEGARHREYRKLGHTAMNQTGVRAYEGMQEREARRLLGRLVQKPEGFVEHFRRNAGASIMMITYGYEVQGDNDPIIDLTEEVLQRFSDAATPGKYVVDFIPILKYVPSWVPGFKFKKIAKEWNAQLELSIELPFQAVQEKMAANTATPSLTSRLLSEATPDTNKEYIKWAVGSLFTGGADTTVSALTSFVLAMTMFPGVQTRARAELDAVVGRERLPGFEDRGSLPYVNALVKEVLRWGCVGPLGIPHRLKQDDEYNGFRIPKDTLVMSNIWAMSRDESIYGPDAALFRPERHMGPFPPTPAKAGGNAAADVPLTAFSTQNTREFGSPAFGFGRRVCPGLNIADATLFINCASVLSAFEIRRAIAVDGKEIVPVQAYTPGVISHPKPFECMIVPRDEKALALVRAGLA